MKKLRERRRPRSRSRSRIGRPLLRNRRVCFFEAHQRKHESRRQPVNRCSLSRSLTFARAGNSRFDDRHRIASIKNERRLTQIAPRASLRCAFLEARAQRETCPLAREMKLRTARRR